MHCTGPDIIVNPRIQAPHHVLGKSKSRMLHVSPFTTAAQLQLTTATATNTTSSAFFPPRPSWQVKAQHAAAPPTTIKHLNCELGSRHVK